MFVVEPQPLKWMNDPVLCAWKVSKNKGDAGWKFGGCWVETVWGSKKSAKVSKLGNFCKHNIL